MKTPFIIFPVALFIAALPACTNHQATNNQTNTDLNTSNTDNHSTQQAAPLTDDELLSSIKSDQQWQSLPLTYEYLLGRWKLAVVSDQNFNNLHLPIVKKDNTTITFNKSTELNNYWVHLPNNCNSMNGEFTLTKTAIKIRGNLATTEMACATPPKALDDNMIHSVILNGDYEIYQKERRILKIHHDHQYWIFINNT